MSCFGLKKPVHPAKKAWCRLATAVQTKLHKLRRSKPVAAILPTPKRRRSGRLHARKLNHQSFAPVFVDELFSRPVSVHVEPAREVDGEKVTLKTTKEEMGERIVDVGSSSSTTFPWGDPSSSSRAMGELSEVDMRAEMFIARFKEEMRLQRQRSFGEYQEMLARGV